MIFLFGTQIYLYINFLLGNNVVVKLDVSPQLLQITRGESDSLKIDHDEDVEFLKNTIKETGKSQKDILATKWFQAELKDGKTYGLL